MDLERQTKESQHHTEGCERHIFFLSLLMISVLVTCVYSMWLGRGMVPKEQEGPMTQGWANPSTHPFILVSVSNMKVYLCEWCGSYTSYVKLS